MAGDRLKASEIEEVFSEPTLVLQLPPGAKLTDDQRALLRDEVIFFHEPEPHVEQKFLQHLPRYGITQGDASRESRGGKDENESGQD